MKSILIINGHPDKESLNYALSIAYQKGAIEKGAKAEIIHIAELSFNPNLSFGYRKRTELEPDLLQAWEQIQQADHLVWVHPLWWGSFPAIMKGFIDRLFLPGIAFEYVDNSIWWKKNLKGKSARIITTMDQPVWYYRLYNRQPGIIQLKKAILKYCGVAPVSVTAIGNVKRSTENQRIKWIGRVQRLGYKLK
jgi:NAD(P)H dehydrogenase (quinone)